MGKVYQTTRTFLFQILERPGVIIDTLGYKLDNERKETRLDWGTFIGNVRSSIFLAFVEYTYTRVPNKISYARHYKPRLVYFLPHSQRPFLCFYGGFFRKFCPYVWLVLKSGLWWCAYGRWKSYSFMDFFPFYRDFSFPRIFFHCTLLFGTQACLFNISFYIEIYMPPLLYWNLNASPRTSKVYSRLPDTQVSTIYLT